MVLDFATLVAGAPLSRRTLPFTVGGRAETSFRGTFLYTIDTGCLPSSWPQHSSILPTPSAKRFEHVLPVNCEQEQ